MIRKIEINVGPQEAIQLSIMYILQKNTRATRFSEKPIEQITIAELSIDVFLAQEDIIKQIDFFRVPLKPDEPLDVQAKRATNEIVANLSLLSAHDRITEWEKIKNAIYTLLSVEI